MRTASQRGRRNRQRGQEFELEVCAAISEATGREVKRILGQERDGGCDLIVGPLKVDCKRRKRIPMIDVLEAMEERYGVGNPGAVVMREDSGLPVILLTLRDFLWLAGDKLR